MGETKPLGETRSIAFALAQMHENRPRRSELQRVKFNLYSIYLLNLHVYLALDEPERADHPVGGVLERVERIFRRIARREQPDEAGRRDRADNKRTMTRDMIKNRRPEKRRAASARNPRVKNREKAKELEEKGKYAFDGNIDVHRSRSAKY